MLWYVWLEGWPSQWRKPTSCYLSLTWSRLSASVPSPGLQMLWDDLDIPVLRESAERVVSTNGREMASVVSVPASVSNSSSVINNFDSLHLEYTSWLPLEPLESLPAICTFSSSVDCIRFCTDKDLPKSICTTGLTESKGSPSVSRLFLHVRSFVTLGCATCPLSFDATRQAVTSWIFSCVVTGIIWTGSGLLICFIDEKGGICNVVGVAGLVAWFIWFDVLLTAAGPSFGTCVAWLCIAGLKA